MVLLSPENIHLVLREHKLAFLHVPKCAGTSVKNAMADALGYKGFGNLKRMRQMWSIERVLEEAGDFLKFTVVRNPFDRLVSVWEHQIRGTGPGHKRVGFDSGITFVEFICSLSKMDVMDMDVCIRPMYSILYKTGYLIPDIVLRLENIEEDWGILVGVVKRYCGLSLPPLYRNRMSADRGEGYRAYYQKDAKRLVESKYKHDLLHFGYSF